MAVCESRISSIASLIAQLGIQAERMGHTIISELRDLMVDSFHQEDRHNHRLSSYFLKLWERQDEIIDDAMITFFDANGSKEREMIDKAISGLEDKKYKVSGYFIGLLMTALLRNHKVVSDNFVDHGNEFSYLINKMVASRFGESFLEKFKPFSDYCQTQYNNKIPQVTFSK